MDDHPSSLRNRDRLSPPPGESLTNRDNASTEQPLSPENERIVSGNPSPEAAVIKRPQSSATVAPDLTIVPPPPQQPNAYDYFSHDQTMAGYAGYGNSTGVWDGYSQHLNAADGMHLSPIIYNDNQSLMFHSGYGYNPDMGYGQYSPMAAPLTPVMLDGQLYSPQQIPFSPFYHPNVPSSGPLGPSELMSSESNSDNSFFGTGSGYLVHYGSFGGGNISGAPGSGSLTSPSAYPQPMGILGPYEHHVAQGSQQRPLHGYGYTSSPSVGHYQHGSSYQSSSFGRGSISYAGANDRTRVGLDKGRRRERDQDSIYSSNDSLGFDRNRGPRASKLKGKNTTDQLSSSGNGKSNSDSSGIRLDLYNQPDFVTEYENAKFFIIKSFSEDNVHKSIKYSVWASTPHGNKNLMLLIVKQRRKKETVQSISCFRGNVTAGNLVASWTGCLWIGKSIHFHGASLSAVFMSSFSRLGYEPSAVSYRGSIKGINSKIGDQDFEAELEHHNHFNEQPVSATYVNASGQFCGVAEMVGPMDFEKDADYWQQDRWNGQFPVQWHIIKDVPNSRFRHILLENNDNKPVTHSRDSQEVKLEQGIEMLKIFKDHDAPTSILDDFEFYDQCEIALKERKAKQPSLKVDSPGLLADDTINQMSDSLVQSLQLDDVNKEPAAREEFASLRPGMEVLPANNCSNNAVELANDSNILVSKAEDSNNHNFPPALKSKDGSVRALNEANVVKAYGDTNHSKKWPCPYAASVVMSSSMSIAPLKEVVPETGEEVDADKVQLNTVLVVKAGEVIPIDGIVVDGNCEVNGKL
ncbi:unnamed protein product [Dovyalis caffra]|uniref:YTH domain-containing protein n=1 Tax=Dovyalis caffra TaxID=77055 RepID=A0AAV1S342_9ROSI|nr:unnamed protein product [Dovyalis caffra]